MKFPILHAGALEPVMHRIFALAQPWAGVKPFTIEIKSHKSKRSLEQNSKMWAMLSDISGQVKWPVNGSDQRLTPEEWKIILSAGLESEQRIAQGINGGFVMLGKSTSKQSIKWMSSMIELIYAFGSERGVLWSEKVPDEFGQYLNSIN